MSDWTASTLPRLGPAGAAAQLTSRGRWGTLESSMSEAAALGRSRELVTGQRDGLALVKMMVLLLFGLFVFE